MLRFEVALGDLLHRLQQPRLVGEAEYQQFARPVDRFAGEALGERDVLEREPLDLGVRTVAARQHPRRGALVDVEPLDLSGQ